MARLSRLPESLVRIIREHWTSRGIIVVIVSCIPPMNPSACTLFWFRLVRHSLRGSLEEDINLLTGRRLLTKFRGRNAPPINYVEFASPRGCSNQAIGRSQKRSNSCWNFGRGHRACGVPSRACDRRLRFETGRNARNGWWPVIYVDDNVYSPQTSWPRLLDDW